MIERTFIEQGMKKIQLENHLKKQLSRAGFTGLHIVKTPLVTRIVLTVARPGLAIGKGGQNIKQLTEDIGKMFGIENPQIEIQDIKNPALDARATVDKMAELIERGFSWKSVAFRTMRDITAAGAQGVELVLKGKLSGKGGRKRKHRVVQGYMKKVGDQVKLVDTAKASAYPKAGAIGITLSIIRPDVIFPDKIKITDAIDAREAMKKEEAAAGEKQAEAEEKSSLEGAEADGKEAPESEGKEAHEGEKATEEEKEKHEAKKPEAKAPEKGHEKEKHEEKKPEARKEEKEKSREKHEAGKEAPKEKRHEEKAGGKHEAGKEALKEKPAEKSVQEHKAEKALKEKPAERKKAEKPAKGKKVKAGAGGKKGEETG